MRRMPDGMRWVLSAVVLAYGSALTGWICLFLASCAIGTLVTAATVISNLPLSLKWSRGLRIVAGIVVAFLSFKGLVTPPLQPPLLNGGVDAAAFAAIPYIDFVPRGADAGAPGVSHLDTTSAVPGVNLYCPTGSSLARLVDLKGSLLHTWAPETDFDDWKYVEFTADGGLLVLATDQGMMKLRPDGSSEWSAELTAHHSFSQTPDGTILALTRKEEFVFWKGLPVPLLNDRITELDANGLVRSETALIPMLRSFLSAGQVARIYGRGLLLPWKAIEHLVRGVLGQGYLLASSPFDVWHSNSIQLLTKPVPGVAQPGDWLISVRNLNLLVIWDPGSGKTRWSWGPGELERQHHATMLGDGTLQVFDNGPYRGWSRIVRLNPALEEISWTYEAQPRNEFVCPYRGSAQPLSNGNILITHSFEGRAFEVTPAGRTVWSYQTPAKNEGRTAMIYRMTRVEDPPTWVARLGASRPHPVDTPSLDLTRNK